MRIRAAASYLIVRLLPESESARLNGGAWSATLAIPEKHDRYNTGQHVPDMLRLATVLAIGTKARASLGCNPRKILMHFASGEPLPNDLRVLTPEQCMAVVE